MAQSRSYRLWFAILLIIGSVVAPVAPAGGSEVEKYRGNPTCEDINASWSTLYKAEFGEGTPAAGSHGPLTWAVSATDLGQVVEWTSSTPVIGVLVKGGPGGYVYDYSPNGTSGDVGLHARTRPSGQWADVSHITFCQMDIPEPEPATVKVEKVTVPADDAAVFTFASTLPGFPLDLGHGQSTTVEVEPGEYSVTEAIADGWELGSMECLGATDVGFDFDAATAFLTVGEGDDVVCTFTNVPVAEPEPATLTLAKITDPADDDVTFRFFGPDRWRPVLGHGDESTIEVEPGTYTLLEKFEHAWELTSIECDGGDPVVDLAEGKVTVTVGEAEDVTCTFTNTVTCPQHGYIAVEKYTEPVDDTVPFAFTSDAESREGDPFLPVLHHGESDYVMVDPGTYSITELPVPGWELGSLVCDDPDAVVDLATATATVTVSSDELATCVFTNSWMEPPTGTLVVEKVADPPDTDETWMFTSDIPGFEPVLGNGETASATVDEGTYTVTEQIDENWDLTDITCTDPEAVIDLGNGDATVYVPAEATVTCTFTNTEVIPPTGTLVIEKFTDPDGSDADFAFTTTAPGFNPILGDGETDSVEVDEGVYTITETPTDGWDLTDITCTDPEAEIDLGNGDATVYVPAETTVTCTFTNTEVIPPTGTLVIEKVTDPTGAAEDFGFMVIRGGDMVVGTTDLSHGETVAYDLAPGDYEVKEMVVAGWELTDIACDPTAVIDLPTRSATVAVVADATVTCTFTNEPIPEPEPATIIVEKVTEPAGADATFDFQVMIGDGGWDFELRDNQSYTLEVITPDPFFGTNVFEIGESFEPGWELIDIDCTDPEADVQLDNSLALVALDPGDTVTCTFTNRREAAPTSSIGDFVWDDRNRNGVQDPGEPGIGGVRVNLYAAPGWEFTPATAGSGGESSPLLATRALVAAQVSTDSLELIATTRTDSNGNYLISDLPAGYYIVEFTGLPTGYRFTAQFAAAKTIDSDAAISNGRTPVMTLPAGFSDITCDAGLFQVPIGGPEELPVTGADLQLPFAVGSGLLLAGALMLLASRPRRETV